jgi:hypothetical protein
MAKKKIGPRRVTQEPATFCTSFCNHPHVRETGHPVDHECYILNPQALLIEFVNGANAIPEELLQKLKGRPHQGLPRRTPLTIEQARSLRNKDEVLHLNTNRVMTLVTVDADDGYIRAYDSPSQTFTCEPHDNFA